MVSSQVHTYLGMVFKSHPSVSNTSAPNTPEKLSRDAISSYAGKARGSGKRVVSECLAKRKKETERETERDRKERQLERVYIKV